MCIPYLVTRIRGSPVDYTSYPIVKEPSSFLEEAVTQKWHFFFIVWPSGSLWVWRMEEWLQYLLVAGEAETFVVTGARLYSGGRL